MSNFLKYYYFPFKKIEYFPIIEQKLQIFNFHYSFRFKLPSYFIYDSVYFVSDKNCNKGNKPLLIFVLFSVLIRFS